mmetsp:Transcript_37554/g.76612  ORF Transcript_37554/g.76612 Transcript_37554/m.76612 type:complete len:248 (+) Transcript_37554:897-1640(+)
MIPDRFEEDREEFQGQQRRHHVMDGEDDGTSSSSTSGSGSARPSDGGDPKTEAQCVRDAEIQEHVRQGHLPGRQVRDVPQAVDVVVGQVQLEGRADLRHGAGVVAFAATGADLVVQEIEALLVGGEGVRNRRPARFPRFVPVLHGEEDALLGRADAVRPAVAAAVRLAAAVRPERLVRATRRIVHYPLVVLRELTLAVVPLQQKARLHAREFLLLLRRVVPRSAVPGVLVPLAVSFVPEGQFEIETG